MGLILKIAMPIIGVFVLVIVFTFLAKQLWYLLPETVRLEIMEKAKGHVKRWNGNVPKDEARKEERKEQ